MIDPRISEHDLELLETYLDNELAGPEADALRARLNGDATLAAALDVIQQQREARHQAFFAMEREALAAAQPMSDTVARSLQIAATREVVWSGRLRFVRQAGALAACLMVGVMVGWYGRSQRAEPARSVGPRIVSSEPRESTSLAVPVSTTGGRNGGGFNVAITDDFGRVIAEQHFDSLAKAEAFSNDIVRWQKSQRQLRNPDVRFVSGGF